MTPGGSPTAGRAPPRLLGGDVAHVWRVELDADGGDATVLSDDERFRAERMGDGRVRRRFLASRAWLRVILGDYLGVDGGTVRFALAGRGKPSLVDGRDLCFSLSRSAGLAFVAVTRGRAVGVDVERVRPDVDHDRVASQFFSPAEATALRELPGPDRQDAFFRLWVRKEAVAKASGAGLGDGIGHLDVRGDAVAGRWSVTTLDAGPGFAAALAVDGASGPVEVRDLPLRG